MLMRPVERVGRRSLVGVAARTAVVAGTATAVVGHEERRSMERQEQAADASAYEQQADAMQAGAPPPAAEAPAVTGISDDTVTQFERLEKLKEEGVLSEEEFAAEKRKVLGL
jgi:hypothetical protein